ERGPTTSVVQRARSPQQRPGSKRSTLPGDWRPSIVLTRQMATSAAPIGGVVGPGDPERSEPDSGRPRNKVNPPAGWFPPGSGRGRVLRRSQIANDRGRGERRWRDAPPSLTGPAPDGPPVSFRDVAGCPEGGRPDARITRPRLAGRDRHPGDVRGRTRLADF